MQETHTSLGCAKGGYVRGVEAIDRMRGAGMARTCRWTRNSVQMPASTFSFPLHQPTSRASRELFAGFENQAYAILRERVFVGESPPVVEQSSTRGTY